MQCRCVVAVKAKQRHPSARGREADEGKKRGSDGGDIVGRDHGMAGVLYGDGERDE